MVDAETVFLAVPPDRAREAVATTLSEQGFVVRDLGGVLEVERDALPGSRNGATSRVTFLVRVVAHAEGSVAHFGDSGGGVVITAAARVARERLAKRGLVSDLDDAGSPSSDSLPDVGPLMPAERDGFPAAGADTHPAPDVGAAQPVGPASVIDEERTPGSPAGVAPPPVGMPVMELPEAERAPREGKPARGDVPPVNLVALLALVLGFVAPVGGIVAGVVALGIVRRTRERGRGLAVTGVVVGSLLTVTVCAAVVGGVSWVLSGPPVAAPTASMTPAPTASITPPRSETPTPSATPAFEPAVGQCFVQRGRGEVGDANRVDCATPHTYELYAQFAVGEDSDPFPGDEEVAHGAGAGCVEAFAGFVGLSWDRSALDYVYLSPTRKTWPGGDRGISCLVTDPAGPVTGTLRDAAR